MANRKTQGGSEATYFSRNNLNLMSIALHRVDHIYTANNTHIWCADVVK